MQLLTDTTYLPLESLNNIETVLTQEFGTVLRWAVVDVFNDKVKVCVSYATISA